MRFGADLSESLCSHCRLLQCFSVLAWPMAKVAMFGEGANAGIGMVAGAIAAFAPGIAAFGAVMLLTRAVLCTRRDASTGFGEPVGSSRRCSGDDGCGTPSRGKCKSYWFCGSTLGGTSSCCGGIGGRAQKYTPWETGVATSPDDLCSARRDSERNSHGSSRASYRRPTKSQRQWSCAVVGGALGLAGTAVYVVVGKMAGLADPRQFLEVSDAI